MIVVFASEIPLLKIEWYIIMFQSYTMRNGVLASMGEILMKVLSKDDLDEKMKDTRDQFLEKIEV